MQDRTSQGGDDPNRPEDAAEGAAPPPDRPEPGPDDRPDATHPAEAAEGERPVAADPLDPTGTPLGVAADPRDPDPASPAAAPAGSAAAVPDHQEHDDHEEEEHSGGRSLAARALIALLLLIAGGALALWGGPRLAPHLPAGLAPVAAWLTPGQNAAEARIAALEAETAGELAALREEVAEVAAREPDLSALEARVAEVETAVADQLEAITAEVSALEGAEGGERLGRLEAALDGQEAALASLREQLEAVGEDGVEGVTAQIDVYQAELEGLRAEVRDLSGRVGGLAGRLEEVAAAAARQVSAAESRVAEAEARAEAALSEAEREAALALIRSALTAGAPYAEATERLADDPELDVPQGLAGSAESGVPTLQSLRDSFPAAAHEAIKANIMARAGDGVLERARAFAEAQVASRSLTPQPGSHPDAVLSRMEEALRQGDLDAALAEAEALPSEAAEAMRPWLDAARARATALADYQTLEAELSATN